MYNAKHNSGHIVSVQQVSGNKKTIMKTVITIIKIKGTTVNRLPADHLKPLFYKKVLKICILM